MGSQPTVPLAYPPGNKGLLRAGRASSVHAVRGLICTRGPGPRLYTRGPINHWFPLIRPAVKPIFLRGYVRGVGGPAIKTGTKKSIYFFLRTRRSFGNNICQYGCDLCVNRSFERQVVN